MLPILDQVRPALLYVYDTGTMSLRLWDGSLTAGDLTIGAVEIDDGFNLGKFDNVALVTATLTDTYTFKRGGSLAATIVITYTDSTKATISTVDKTPK